MKDRGSFYERKAAEFLKIKGCRIIERNFYTREGEIDIICKDGEVIAFVEVKARKGNSLSLPKEAVNSNKVRRIKRAALAYASKNADSFFRFDVLEIIQGESWRWYNLIKAAFDYTGDEI